MLLILETPHLAATLTKGFKVFENRSQTKIAVNNVFENSFENSPKKHGRCLTRSAKAKLGLPSKKSASKLPNRYKIINTNLLNEALQAISNCSKCRHHDDSHLVLTANQMKYGLAEKLCLKCSHCGYEHKFESSTKNGPRINLMT